LYYKIIFIIFENNIAVSLMQPYTGIFIFFIIAMLNYRKEEKQLRYVFFIK